jgi:hypothetical protein
MNSGDQRSRRRRGVPPAPAPLVRRRPGYSSSGCTPAEPDSASPGPGSIAQRWRWQQRVLETGETTVTSRRGLVRAIGTVSGERQATACQNGRPVPGFDGSPVCENRLMCLVRCQRGAGPTRIEGGPGGRRSAPQRPTSEAASPRHDEPVFLQEVPSKQVDGRARRRQTDGAEGQLAASVRRAQTKSETN